MHKIITSIIAALALVMPASAQQTKPVDKFAVFEHCDNIGVWAKRYLGMRSAGMTEQRALEIAGPDPAHKAIARDAYTVAPRSILPEQFARKWVDRCTADPEAFGFEPKP